MRHRKGREAGETRLLPLEGSVMAKTWVRYVSEQGKVSYQLEIENRTLAVISKTYNRIRGTYYVLTSPSPDVNLAECHYTVKDAKLSAEFIFRNV